MNVIDKILNEWSFRCHDGIVDMNDPKKVIILNEILADYNLDELNPIMKEIILFLDNKYGLDFNIISYNSFTVLVPSNFYKSREDIINDLLKNNPNDFTFEKTSKSTIGRLKYKNKIIIYFKPAEKNIAGEHIEIAQKNYINDFINNNKGDKKGIDIMIGNTLYKNIYKIEKIEKNKQADFILLGEEKNAFIQHKDAISQQYSGINNLLNNDEVKSFINDVKNKLNLENQTELKEKESYKRKIKSDDLKKIATYGIDKEFGINKVEAVFFGNLELKPSEDNKYFILYSPIYFVYDETPTGEYEPYLAVTYRKGRNQQNIKNARFGFYPEKYVKNFKEISNEEQPLQVKGKISVPKEKVTAGMIDGEWFNDQNFPLEIKSKFEIVKDKNNKNWYKLTDTASETTRLKITEELTNALLELLDSDHFQLRVNERGNILDILNLKDIPLKDYNPSEVKEKLKLDISSELKSRAETLLSKDIPSSNTYDVGIKVLKPILNVDGKKYPLNLFAISTKEIKDKDGNVTGVREIENKGTLYFATVVDNKITTLLLLSKEDDNDLYFQIKNHIEQKTGEKKEAKILTPPSYIYEIDLDELMGTKKDQGPIVIDQSTLPYKVRTDYRVGANFDHEKHGTGKIVATSAGSGGKGDARGSIDWIDVKYPKPFLKGGKLTDIRRFDNIITLASPLLAK